MAACGLRFTGPMEHAGMFPGTSMPDRDWWQELWPNPQAMMRELGVKPGARAIDICCGDGYFTVPLAQLTAPGETLGVELDREALALAHRDVQAAGATNITLIEADVCELRGLVDGTFDFIFVASTLHGIPDKQRMIHCMSQLLARGGLLAVVNWHALSRKHCEVFGKARGPRPELRMPPAALRYLAENNGFTEIEFYDVGPYHYASIYRR